MGIFTGIIVYLLTFFTVIFCVLPWGVKPHENSELGTAGSAPEAPNLKKKIIVTAILSAVIWGIIYTLIEMNVIDFYDIAERMEEEDFQE